MALLHPWNLPHLPLAANGPEDGARDASRDTRVDEIADTILRYLSTRPHAMDTVEGVTDWWIPRQRYEEALANVQEALDALVGQGRLVASVGRDGQAVYRLPRDGDEGATEAGHG